MWRYFETLAGWCAVQFNSASLKKKNKGKRRLFWCLPKDLVHQTVKSVCLMVPAVKGWFYLRKECKPAFVWCSICLHVRYQGSEEIVEEGTFERQSLLCKRASKLTICHNFTVIQSLHAQCCLHDQLACLVKAELHLWDLSADLK